MTDPFLSLRADTLPRSPDPTFTSQLRSRLQRAFDLPKGVTVSNLTIEDQREREALASTPPAAGATSRASYTLTPYLAVAGAEGALRFYADAFGARLHGEPIVMPDSRIGHAELDIEGAVFMLSEEHPEIGVTAPEAGASVTLLLTVTDVDAVMERAVAAGATLSRAAADYDHGRNGVILDPFGHRWMISALPAQAGTAAPAEDAVGTSPTATDAPRRTAVRHGDVGYVSLFVPDTERALLFYSAVLGWEYEPGSGVQGRQVRGLNIHHGVWGDQEYGTLFLCFAVDDIASAVQRVRAAGGTADEPRLEPYGLASGCTDDDGVRFAVFEAPSDDSERAAGAAGAGGTQPSPGQGNLEYITMETRSSATARAFYGTVLGWRFSPGHVEDGWQVDDVDPLVGISSGHDRPAGVPMYRVDDIASAVERVRVAGGTATVPDAEPYGTISACVDDQGTRFYLGEMTAM
jgi:predicted enzyme related to lactoylglutathione lyase